jgi:hypothetical protein
MTRKFSARSLKNLNGIHPDLRRVMDTFFTTYAQV